MAESAADRRFERQLMRDNYFKVLELQEARRQEQLALMQGEQEQALEARDFALKTEKDLRSELSREHGEAARFWNNYKSAQTALAGNNPTDLVAGISTMAKIIDPDARIVTQDDVTNIESSVGGLTQLSNALSKFTRNTTNEELRAQLQGTLERLVMSRMGFYRDKFQQFEGIVQGTGGIDPTRVLGSQGLQGVLGSGGALDQFMSLPPGQGGGGGFDVSATPTVADPNDTGGGEWETVSDTPRPRRRSRSRR